MFEADVTPIKVKPAEKFEPAKKDISEPVLTLLEELTKDVWEVVGSHFNDWVITHVYKESVVLYLCSSDYITDSYYSIYGMDWMTSEESRLVIKALRLVVSKQAAIAEAISKINKRVTFAKALGVTMENQ